MKKLTILLLTAVLALVSGCAGGGASSSVTPSGSDTADSQADQDANFTIDVEVHPTGLVGNILSGTFGIVGNVVDGSFGFVDDIVDGNTIHHFENENMKHEKISDADISGIKLDNIYAAIYIQPSSDADIHLEYSACSDFHVAHEVVDATLHLSADMGNLGNHDHVLMVSIPANLIKQLDIVGDASYIHLVGQDGILRVCNINVSAAAVYLQNIYADTTVTTSTGAIRLKNETVSSNIHLKTQIGVIDMTLGELPDDVSLYTEGTVSRNAFLGTRKSVSPNERYAVTAESSIGVINIHE